MSEWKLLTVDPQEKKTWRSGVIPAIHYIISSEFNAYQM